LISVLWLSEPLTKARVISIIMSFFWIDIAFIQQRFDAGSFQYWRPVQLSL